MMLDTVRVTIATNVCAICGRTLTYTRLRPGRKRECGAFADVCVKLKLFDFLRTFASIFMQGEMSKLGSIKS